MKPSPGNRIHSTRANFRAMGSIGFVHMSAEEWPWKVTVCPFDQRPRATGVALNWWEDAEITFELGNALLRIFKGIPLKGVRIVFLDDDFNLVEAP